LQVDRIAASLTVRAPVMSRSASASASGANVTRSRTSSGAVVWLSPTVWSDMALPGPGACPVGSGAF